MRSNIPINKPLLGDDEVKAIRDVLLSGILTDPSYNGGKLVREFENRFARFVGAKYSVAVSSGTAALHLALLAAGVGPGDEVIVPSFSFLATATTVLLVGAKPVFADIDIKTYNIDPESIKPLINEKTKAIIPVHLYGLPAEMDNIMEIAEKHNLVVIEDAAQAHGAKYKGKYVGNIGHMACFSFYPTKNMTTGEGGIVTTNIDEYAKRIRLLRSHGQKEVYEPIMLGYNYRMTELEAAIGIVQLSKLPKFLNIRENNAKKLTELLSDLDDIILPFVPKYSEHSWNVYTIRCPNEKVRNELKSYLRNKGVGASVYYEIPIHRTPLFTNLGYGNLKLRNTEEASKTVLSLPIHPRVSDTELAFIAELIKEFLKRVYGEL